MLNNIKNSVAQYFKKFSSLLLIDDTDEFVWNYIELLKQLLATVDMSAMQSLYAVEFFGTPEAGKTTTVSRILVPLRNSGISVTYLRESAEILPDNIPKNSIYSHFWMQLNTIISFICSSLETNRVTILDRGIADTLCWNEIFVKKGELSKAQHNELSKILASFLPNSIIVFVVSPEESIRRRGGEGRIVTLDFIKDYNCNVLQFCGSPILRDTPIRFISTEGLSIYEASKITEKYVLDGYSQWLKSNK